MNYIHREMIIMGADGVIFHPIGMNNEQILMNPIQEHTLKSIESAKTFPRSGRSYYKIINGKRVLYDYAKQLYIEINTNTAKYKVIKELNDTVSKMED